MWAIVCHFLVPDVADVMQGPDTLRTARCLLHYDQIFTNATGPIAHAYSQLVPDNQINNIQVRFVKPGTEAGTEVKFICP